MKTTDVNIRNQRILIFDTIVILKIEMCCQEFFVKILNIFYLSYSLKCGFLSAVMMKQIFLAFYDSKLVLIYYF